MTGQPHEVLLAAADLLEPRQIVIVPDREGGASIQVAPILLWLRYAADMYEMAARRAKTAAAVDNYVSSSDRGALDFARMVLASTA